MCKEAILLWALGDDMLRPEALYSFKHIRSGSGVYEFFLER